MNLFAAVLILASCIIASPVDFAIPVDVQKRGSSVAIGWRTVAKGQADQYKSHGNSLYWSNDWLKNPAQTGSGVYTSPGPRQWVIGDWQCVILADSDAWNKINKAWVPSTDPSDCTKSLWFPKDPNDIANYLKTLDPSFTPANTVTLSLVSGGQFPGQLQAAIPPQLIGPGLKTNVQCVEITDDAGIAAFQAAYGQSIDYSQWNAKGSK